MLFTMIEHHTMVHIMDDTVDQYIHTVGKLIYIYNNLEAANFLNKTPNLTKLSAL